MTHWQVLVNLDSSYKYSGPPVTVSQVPRKVAQKTYRELFFLGMSFRLVLITSCTLGNGTLFAINTDLALLKGILG